MYRPKDIIYSLKTEDIQSVAKEELSRELTEDELKRVIEELPGYIDWQQAIALAMLELKHST